jgi:2-hydroxychromene-2-carboxylate isomerase
MRGCFVADEAGCLPAFARRVFERYWGELADISRDDVIGPILDELGLARGEFFEKIASTPYKAKLRETTDELIERGGFGSPTLFVDADDMYFGNDRLPLVRAALLGCVSRQQHSDRSVT